MAWWDGFKLALYAFRPDPLSSLKDTEDVPGQGVTQPDVIDMMKAGFDGMGGAGRGFVRLHESNDFVDMTSVQNRQARYKEYERLRNVAEIETAMTIFADESCIAGNTKITTPFGAPTIKWLAENKTNERFLVYSFDADKGDYTLAWAFNPRKTGTKPVCKVYLDNGSHFICTTDHRVLKRDGKWTRAGELVFGDELMAFYRIPANTDLTEMKTKQFPRIFTYNDGWIHERAFVDKWKTGKLEPRIETALWAMRLLAEGLASRQISKIIHKDWQTIHGYITKLGFATKEVKWLGHKEDRRRVVGIQPYGEMDVYDLSVEDHHCFCSDSVVFHNCQVGEKDHVLTIECDDKDIKEEAEWFFYTQLEVDEKLWNWAKNLFIYGDWFGELVFNPDNPKDGVLKVQALPPDSMFRIETTKGRLVEFQQSKEGPDYHALEKVAVEKASDEELSQSTALRFTPDQICHIKIGDDRKTFYPYGVALIEPARGPAHQLRMMEDAMLVYRLTRAPERRVFYIDVGTIAPFRAEAFMERMKDQFKKKKTTGRTGLPGASAVEERWHAPSADEDYWIPVRSGSQTKIETLPGAQNLGEIDDALYFRKKLLVALNIPEAYLIPSETSQIQTRMTLSAQDARFARLVERLQQHIERGLMDILKRHLTLMGFPKKNFEDIKVKITPPSDWRELSRSEVVTNRINNASTYKSGQLLSDYDIYVDILKLTPDEAKEKLSRMKVQKLEDMKLQILAQNPALLGVGIPGEGDQEVGSEVGGGGEQEINPDDHQGTPDQQPGPPPEGGPPGPPPEGGPPGPPPENGNNQEQGQTLQLPEPTEEDIKKYDLGIEDYKQESDEEDVDYSEL